MKAHNLIFVVLFGLVFLISACNEDLANCQNNLSNCNSSLATCSSSLVTCNQNFQNCQNKNIELNARYDELNKSCHENLERCNVLVETNENERVTCATNLTACSMSLQNAKTVQKASYVELGFSVIISIILLFFQQFLDTYRIERDILVAALIISIIIFLIYVQTYMPFL